MQAYCNLQTHHQASLPSEDGIVFCPEDHPCLSDFLLRDERREQTELNNPEESCPIDWEMRREICSWGEMPTPGTTQPASLGPMQPPGWRPLSGDLLWKACELPLLLSRIIKNTKDLIWKLLSSSGSTSYSPCKRVRALLEDASSQDRRTKALQRGDRSLS